MAETAERDPGEIVLADLQGHFVELLPTLLPGQQLGVREPDVAGHAQGRHETVQKPDRVVIEPEPEEGLGQAEHLGGADRRVGEAEREPDGFVAPTGLAQKVPVRRVLKRLVAMQVAQAGQVDIVGGEFLTDVRRQEKQTMVRSSLASRTSTTMAHLISAKSGTLSSTFAEPKPRAITTLSPRRIATDIPGMCSRRSSDST